MSNSWVIYSVCLGMISTWGRGIAFANMLSQPIFWAKYFKIVLFVCSWGAVLSLATQGSPTAKHEPPLCHVHSIRKHYGWKHSTKQPDSLRHVCVIGYCQDYHCIEYIHILLRHICNSFTWKPLRYEHCMVEGYTLVLDFCPWVS